MGCVISRTPEQYDTFAIVGFPVHNDAIRIEEIMTHQVAYSGNPVILGCRQPQQHLFYGGHPVPHNADSVILQCNDEDLTTSIHENNGIFAPVGDKIGDFYNLNDFECRVV